MRHLMAGAMLALAAGTVAAHDLKITPRPGQGISYVNGKPAIISTKDHGVATLMLVTERVPNNAHFPLLVGVENKTAAGTNFTIENVAVRPIYGRACRLTVLTG